MAKCFQLLQNLPEELLQSVLERLNGRDLTSLNLTSRWCYHVATPVIWREVNLRDRRTFHEDGSEDHHDDTPLLRKLLILAQNPWIGSCVHTLTHSCHLPPPAIFDELSKTPLSGQTLSPDPRTAKLVQLAVKNMPNVHTLRIIFGHPNINDVLLRCFFDKYRKRTIRRLWLECCRISAGCDLIIKNSTLQLPLELDFSGLESIRFRRLPLRPEKARDTSMPHLHFVHARGGHLANLQDDAGGVYVTPINYAELELRQSSLEIDYIREEKIITPPADIAFASRCDDMIYELLAQDAVLPIELAPWTIESHEERARIANRGQWLDPNLASLDGDSTWDHQRERRPSSHVMLGMLVSCSATLTSLCLDWIFTMPIQHNTLAWKKTFQMLFSLRFPHLKAFQFRNGVVQDTTTPPGLYLLDTSDIYEERTIQDEETGEVEIATVTRQSLCAVEFLEAHPNLQCLSWPMESFFSNNSPELDVTNRIQAVIDNLGRTLVDLRVDTIYNGQGEPQSENDVCPDVLLRERRRRFIAEFAAKMKKVESIKIEGGVPRDERREIILALHNCPLSKIVMIGVCCPLGNTWGPWGADLNESLHNNELSFLEAEHKDSVYSLGPRDPQPPSANFVFRPTYGWPPGPPMMHTLASLHCETVKELKFCGYKGAPVLFTPTPITNPMLAALKHFHKLESLILSMWLNTEFEDDHRDADIIKYWLDALSPRSTSLVRITDEEPEGWEKELRTKYAPPALAWWVTGFIGSFLSEEAKSRRGGVHVRVSMCIGELAGIFDIDLHIGKGSMNSDICLGYQGPREELEPGRRRSKLEGRRWF